MFFLRSDDPASLYGLRQSLLYWFSTIKPVIESLGFESPESDACPFRNNELGMIAAPDTKLIDRTRDGLKRSYDLKELGEDKRFLGFDVIRDREARTVFISQESYVSGLSLRRRI